MSTTNSKIQWTDRTWNPVRGCSRVSPGCDNCYAMGQAHRFAGPGMPFEGLTTLRNGKVDWSGVARFIPEALDEPLSWRKPARIFVNSMSDLFHHSVTDAEIMRVWLTMARASWHTFQILTKRADRMAQWVKRWSDVEPFDAAPAMKRGPAAIREHHTSGRAIMFAEVLDGMGDPPAGAAFPTYDWAGGPRWLPAVLPNVWLGVSAEDQKRADDRISLLLETPATVRFVSAEPLLGPIDLFAFVKGDLRDKCLGILSQDAAHNTPGIDWMIVGGESGPGARPCDVGWIRDVVAQCGEARVPCFTKQLGAVVRDRNDAGFDGEDGDDWPEDTEIEDFAKDPNRRYQGAPCRVLLKDRKGGDPSEWPEDLRVRQFPGEDSA